MAYRVGADIGTHQMLNILLNVNMTRIFMLGKKIGN